MRMFGKIVAGLVAVLLLGGLGWIFYDRIADLRAEPEGRDGAPSVAVETAPIDHGSIRELRLLTGTVRAGANYEIATRIDGTIQRLHVDLGDPVQPGQVVAELDDQEYAEEIEQQRAEVEVARARLAEARSAMQIAERNYQRTRQLYERDIASSAQLDEAQSTFESRSASARVAESELARQEAALRRVQVRHSYTTIRAQWAGDGVRYVGQRLVDEGATVSSNQGIVRLVDLDTVNAIVHVDASDYMQLSTGQSAELVLGRGSSNQRMQGQVTRIAPLFGEASRQAEVQVQVENTEHLLKPGMFVQVLLELGRAEQATLVPRASIVNRDGMQGVFMVEPLEEAERVDLGVVRFVPIVTGIREGPRVQLLEPGEIQGHVVTLGQHLLSDGTEVTVDRGGLGDRIQHTGESTDDGSATAP